LAEKSARIVGIAPALQDGVTDIVQLPEDAILTDSLEVLDCWINGRMRGAPDWIRAAAKTLTAIELAALCRRGKQPAWAFESARYRLRIAALANDGVEASSLFHIELEQFDRSLRTIAQKESDENVRLQIGAIRMELRRQLAKRVNVRQRAAYGTARVAV